MAAPPRYFCTYLQKYASDEKSNMSDISVKSLILHSACRRLLCGVHIVMNYGVAYTTSTLKSLLSQMSLSNPQRRTIRQSPPS